MFEIGMRYSFGKPALVIAEEGTRLPFDVIDENTLFYINDPKGAAELRKKIGQFCRKNRLRSRGLWTDCINITKSSNAEKYRKRN